MNRQIKFRGKAKTGEWVYGDLVNTNDKIYIVDIGSLDISGRLSGDYYKGIHCGLEDNGIEDRYEACDYGLKTAQDIYDEEIFDGFIEVDPKTVGQDTGLKEDNKKDVYEGDYINIIPDHNNIKDIVEKSFKINYKVIFEDGCFLISAFGICNGLTSSHKSIKVVGNKFDHPELLEEKNEIK